MDRTTWITTSLSLRSNHLMKPLTIRLSRSARCCMVAACSREQAATMQQRADLERRMVSGFMRWLDRKERLVVIHVVLSILSKSYPAKDCENACFSVRSEERRV